MGKSSDVRDEDKLASSRPKKHVKLSRDEPYEVLRDVSDGDITSQIRMEDSQWYKDNPEYQDRGLSEGPRGGHISEISMSDRDSKIINEQIKKQNDQLEKYRLEGKEEVGSAIATPSIKGQKSKLGEMSQEGAPCPSGDCPDAEMFKKVSGTPWDSTKDFVWFGDFDGTCHKAAWEWVLEDNAMFNKIEIVKELDLSIFDNNPINRFWGGLVGTNYQKQMEDHLWRDPTEYAMNGKIQGKMVHWDWITHYRPDYVEEPDRKFLRYTGYNSEWGCLIWYLRDCELVETMPILLWGDTSIAWTFTEGFQRMHGYQSEPDHDSREDVQEYIESYTDQDPIIIINTDLSDGPILDWSGIDSRHIIMDLAERDVPSPFIEAAKANGNETFDGLGYFGYCMMTKFNDILWNKAYKHIDVKRLIRYLQEWREYNAS